MPADPRSPVRCAVLGDPIAHSLSPVLHRTAYAALGLDWHYDAVRVPAGGLAAFVAGLGEEWRGLSLTMPLKREAPALAPEVSDRARLVGAANTLVLDAGRPVLADNTDLPGAVAAVRERYDGPVGSGTVLGGGATAASTGLALVELGAREVTLLVRSPDRAAEAAAAVGRHPARPSVRVGVLGDDPVTGDVVVSTVPASAQDEALVARCSDVPVVLEAVYDPWPTPLAAAAAAGGRVLVGGLDLLAHQAVLQVALMTGRDVPAESFVDDLRVAGASVLATRGAAG